ncbi:hypothetical protein M427DRAFT_55353 [Gonapodya prolifera JEL478]|uniref:CS domain-containing protein n=1 Tax=Gonapodya prolifera (strain JEL478) TaxID=1344416 RepID=A0A139AJ36_GONPJ|nr:hypothetical protein M427DRAFT_55353 [Gonapodya prolifera JEL478]|eukprot:KXS16728.1 hypothetical protein M427DRAFT_55353 [Gonapodya prolifera JEL478]
MLSTFGPPPPASDPSQAALAYAFAQSAKYVDVTVSVPSTFSTKDLTVKIKETTLEVQLKGEKTYRILGTLFGKADAFESLWQVENVKNSPRKLVTIHLEKHPSNQIPWPVLIRSGLQAHLQPVATPDELLDDPTLDSHSLFLLANYYEEDHLADVKDTVRMLEEAAKRGSTYAKLRLAAAYHLGAGDAIKPDPALSHSYYLSAAEDGSAVACYAIAGSYQNPSNPDVEGAEPNFKEALRWMDRAVFGVEDLRETRPELFKDACFNAGLMCLQGGFGIGEGNPQMAMEYWKHSVALGHPQSCYNTAVLLLNGPGLLANGAGVQRNVEQAVRLFRAANMLDHTLSLPEELSQLGDKGIERLVELDRQHPETPIGDLVAQVKADVDSGVLRPATPIDRSINGHSPEKRKRRRRRDTSSSWGGTMYFAVGAVGLAVLGLWAYRRYGGPTGKLVGDGV